MKDDRFREALGVFVRLFDTRLDADAVETLADLVGSRHEGVAHLFLKTDLFKGEAVIDAALAEASKRAPRSVRGIRATSGVWDPARRTAAQADEEAALLRLIQHDMAGIANERELDAARFRIAAESPHGDPSVPVGDRIRSV